MKVARYLKGGKIGFREQRVVIEHFLEVRDQPAFIRRIPGKPAANVVVHAARGHGVQRFARHVKRVLRPGAVVLTKEKKQAGGRREFGGWTKPAVHRVEIRGKLFNGSVDFLLPHRRGSRGTHGRLQPRRQA